MKKLFFTLLVTISISYANTINAIALIVNEVPITLYDIEKRKFEKNISKDKAVSQLVDEALFDELVNKYNITADVFDVNNYLEKIAASNGIDLYTFKSIIKQKYKDFSQYEEQTRQAIIKQKLTEQIVRGNIKIATDEDLKIYYDNNLSKFQMSSGVKAIQYNSINKELLNQAIQNPIANIKGVIKTPIDLNQEAISSQLRYIINETKVNQFTPIFTANEQFVSLLITQKVGEKTIAFEDVKDKVFNIVMQNREQKYLKDYFEKLKLSADIKIVR